jgi:hypothetical protein
MRHDDVGSPRARTGRGLRVVPAALGALLVGCGPTLGEAARQVFVQAHAGCEATARERFDLEANVVEVTGCDDDQMYRCVPGHINQVTGYWKGAECARTTECTRDGCGPADWARNAFAKDHACPVARVAAAPRAPVVAAAPADVAADPARMRIWTEAHQAQIEGHTSVTATGCGSEALYDCRSKDCAPVGAAEKK